MNDTTTPVDLARRARRRVARKLGFFIHLLVFVLVNAGLLLVDWASGGPRWHHWPLAGWAIGLAIHGVVTFLSLSGEGLRERMVADELRRLQQRR